MIHSISDLMETEAYTDAWFAAVDGDAFEPQLSDGSRSNIEIVAYKLGWKHGVETVQDLSIQEKLMAELSQEDLDSLK